MPTVLNVGPYRLFFYASDKDEATHIHVERENNIAKFWLDPIRLQNSGGFNRAEIRKMISEHHQQGISKNLKNCHCEGGTTEAIFF